MMRVVPLLLALTAASPASAAEPAHCSVRITPEFTELPSHYAMSSEGSANPFSETDSEGRFLNTRLNQTRRLGACDFDISQDIVFWTGVYRQEGCSDVSPIARSFRWFWTAGVDELKAERKDAMQNAPRDPNGLVAINHVRGIVDSCIFLKQPGAWHLSVEN